MSSDLINYLGTLIVISFFANLGMALYGIFRKPNLVKKLIALTILADTANAFAILVGARKWPEGAYATPPVLLNLRPSSEDIENFVRTSVDPLPQALVLTAIVIGLAVTIFLAMLVLHIHRMYGTVDTHKLSGVVESEGSS